MAKEKGKHDGLLCFLLALIVVLILVIGGGAYYFLVLDNGEEIANTENEIKKSIILEGIYSIKNSDNFWEFNKNGTVKSWSNLSEEVGTYTINDNKEISITYTHETYVWNEGISEKNISNRTEKLKYIDEKTLLTEENIILVKQDNITNNKNLDKIDKKYVYNELKEYLTKNNMENKVLIDNEEKIVITEKNENDTYSVVFKVECKVKEDVDKNYKEATAFGYLNKDNKTGKYVVVKFELTSVEGGI